MWYAILGVLSAFFMFGGFLVLSALAAYKANEMPISMKVDFEELLTKRANRLGISEEENLKQIKLFGILYLIPVVNVVVAVFKLAKRYIF